MSPNKRYAKTQRAQSFLKSEEGVAAYEALVAMVSDANYNTDSTFSPSETDGILTFVDKHMDYLCSHPNVKSEHYLSNLRLIARIR